MTRTSQALDSGKRLLLEHAPWALRYLNAVRGKGLDVRVLPDRITISDPRTQRHIWLNRANAVYVPDVVGSFEYSFSAVEPFEQTAVAGGGKVVDYASPRFHRVPGFDDFPVLFPSTAEPYQTCQQYLDFAQLREGHTVLDLGCYSGLTAIAFSKAVGPSGRVVSAEPDPGNHATSVQNLGMHRRVNGLDNVSLHAVAVAGNTGTLTFSSEGAMGSSAVSVVGGFRGRVVEIPCVTLEELARRAGVERVDFIKMDIEGSELEVVERSGAFLRAHRPRMIIEPHKVGGTLDAEAVMSALAGYGYRCEIIEQWGVSLPLVTAVPLPAKGL